MSKTLLRILIIALPILSGFSQQFDRSQSVAAKGANHSAAQSGPRTVEVTFDGLMVFAKVGNHYELGVLEPNTAVDHEFKITVGKDPIDDSRIKQLLSLGNTWTLDVVSGSGTRATTNPPNVTRREAKTCNRPLDTTNEHTNYDHVFDFCWMMDLENEFHGGRALALRPNKLKPIIFLNGGELSSKFKYDELEKERKPNDYISYGFVTETTGLKVDLGANERLVLKVGGETVFSLPTADGITNAGIFNAPKKHYVPTKRDGQDHSHFLYYYDVFSNVASNERYDVRAKTDGRRPLNRYFPDLRFHNKNYLQATNRADDEVRMRTVDDMACGGGFLGKRTRSLTVVP